MRAGETNGGWRPMGGCLTPLLWVRVSLMFTPMTASITVLSPFGTDPGSLNSAARVFAELLGESLGVAATLRLDKALGNVTAYACTQAPADGSVVLLGGFGPTVLDPWYRKQACSPLEQLRFIGQVSWMPILLFAARQAPFDDLHGFIEHARRHPGMTVGIGRPRGGSPEPSTALLARLAGVELAFTDQTVDDLRAGRILAAAFHPFEPQCKAVLDGVARPLATYTPARLAGYPDTPTLIELGYPMAFTSWRVAAVPRATDEATFEKLRAAVERIARDPRFHAALSNPSGEIPTWRGPQETERWIRAQAFACGRIIKDLGLAE